MNKAILLCAGLLLWAAQLLAAPANISITSERGVPFRLTFDGRVLTRGVTREVYLDRVRPGVHWAEFRVPAGRHYVTYRTQVQLDAGFETRYVLLTRQGYPPVLRRVATVPMRGAWRRSPGSNDYRNGYDYRPSDGARSDADGYYSPRPTPDYADRSETNRPGNQGYNNRDYDNRDQNRDREDDRYPEAAADRFRNPLSRVAVEDLARQLNTNAFDSDRLTLAKEALTGATIRTADLVGLLRAFDFETQRLEMAKLGYDHLADPENFQQVYTLFNFDSNVRELQQYSREETRREDDRRAEATPGRAPGRYARLSGPMLQDLLRAAGRQPLDQDKLLTLQNGLAQSLLSTGELKQLLRLFGGETPRVALAKYAYAHLTDASRFEEVYELFSYRSNVQELQDYVSRQPRR